MTCARFGALSATLALLLAGCAEKPAADVVLSPAGEVRTLADAVEKTRQLRASGTVTNRAVEVLVEPGVYRMTEAVTLTPSDSGLHFTGAGFENSVFDGGIELEPFVAGADGLWRTKAPKGLAIDQLWVGNRRAQRAREPNRFYLYMENEATDATRRAFVAHPREFNLLAGLSAAERARAIIAYYLSWDMGYSHIERLEAATRKVYLSCAANARFFSWDRTQPRYAIENVRAALDAPGEWFHDVEKGVVLYIPREGEKIETTRAVVPVAQGLVSLAGGVKKGGEVRDIAFRNLGFVHTAWLMGLKGQPNGQAAANVHTAVISGQAVRDFVLENCRVAQTGAHGLHLRGLRASRVRHALFEDLGAGGIYVGGDKTEKGEFLSEDFEISDSIVRHGGRVLPSAIGVWISNARRARVVHNDIYDFFYTGVSFGWTWGYAPTLNRDNHIDFNRIHHIGQGMLSDLGAVYSLGDNEGSTVCCNWIHDVTGYRDNGSPAWGLYTDEGSHGILLASNLVTNCRDGAFHQHYGRDNEVVNNIFAEFNRAGVWRSRLEDHRMFAVRNNIFYWTDPKGLAYIGHHKNGADANLPCDGNLYWCTSDATEGKKFLNVSWEEWHTKGADAHGLVADPMFVDASRGDWRLRADSPAHKLGFREFDWRQAGVLQTDAAWRAKADERTWDDFEDAPSAPRYIRDHIENGFEGWRTGELLNTMDGYAPFQFIAGKSSALTVVEGDAAEGRKALRFVDDSTLPHSFMPHTFARLRMEKGSGKVRFAFKPLKSAGMSFELRDVEVAPYSTAICIRHDSSALSAGGERLCPVQLGQWYEVSIRVHFDGAQARTLEVEAHPRGAAPGPVRTIRFPKTFKSLTWLGFMCSGAKNDSQFLIDDFAIYPEK